MKPCLGCFNARAVALFAAALAPVCAIADTDWTAGSTATVKYWSDDANWNFNGETRRVHYNTLPSSLKGKPVEINFNAVSTIPAGLWLQNLVGGPITFRAASDDYGLVQTGGEVQIGTGNSNNGKQGAFIIDGGTYRFNGNMNVSNASWDNDARGEFTLLSGRVETGSGLRLAALDSAKTGSYASAAIKGGSFTANGEVWICSDTASTASLTIEGGAFTNTSYMVLGRTTKGYTSSLTVNGGEVYNDGITVLGSQIGNGGTAELVVNGGVYRTTGTVFIGEGFVTDTAAATGSATLTVNGGTFDNSAGTTKFAVNAKLNNSGFTYTASLNLNGGVYATKAIEYGDGAIAAAVNFNGGTLRAAGSGSLFPANGHLTVTVGEEGGVIDTQGCNVTIDREIAGPGDLTKRGAGDLEFTVVPQIDGMITVEAGGGTVTLPAGATTVQCGLYTKSRTGADGRIVFYNANFDNHWNALGGADTDWQNAANWDTGLDGAANYVIRKQEMNEAAVAVSFAGAYSIPTGLWIENGVKNAVTFSSGAAGAGLAIGTLGSEDQGLNIGTGFGGGNLRIEGASVWSQQDIDIGNNGEGHLAIAGGGTVKCISKEGWAKWVVLGVYGSSNASISLQEGGTLEAWHIQRYTTGGEAKIHFTGGTLRALASTQLVGDHWGRAGMYPTLVFWEAGGTIDTQGFDATIDAPVSGTGPLYKAGSGALTITGDMTGFSGTITVPEGCGSVTVPADAGAQAGENTKRVISDTGITFYNDDGSLSVTNGEELVWLGHRRVRGAVYVEGTLKLGTPADIAGCTLDHDFARDNFDANFTNAGGELVWTGADINGRAAVHSDAFGVKANTKHTVRTTFAVLQCQRASDYSKLFRSSDDRWSIARRNKNFNNWQLYTYSWEGTGSLYQNGVQNGCPIVTTPFVLTCTAGWPRYSPDDIYCGDGSSSMTWGEVALYNRELNEDERTAVEEYLMCKWGFTDPKFAYQPLCEVNDVTMAQGSTLNLGGHDVTVKSFKGAGTVENGTLRTVDNTYRQQGGKLTIPAVAGATYYASSSHDVLEITGASGKSVTIRFPAGWHDANSAKSQVVFCEGSPNFVWEGEAVELYNFGNGWWGFYNSDIGSFSDENSCDNAYEEEQSDGEAGLAFPGAHGWGRFAKGARASSSPSVYRVTNLNDKDSGSLRDAVSRPNRIVVFDVSGVINISSRITFASNLYVAGQTAPGEGITVYGDGCSFSGANNIICRYLRWRMGHGGSADKDCAGIANGANMIFDHCSFSWGLDETFSINPDGKGTPPQNITLQNCIFGQGLMTHSAGGLMQADYITLYRNLYVDNSTRNNKVKGINQYANNIVYNWKNGCYIMGGDSSGASYCAIEGNLFINGPVSSSSNAFGGGNGDFHFYGNDNWQDKNRNGRLDPGNIDGSQTGGGAYTSDKASLGVEFPALPLYAGDTLLANNLRKVGASLPYRDLADSLMVEEVNSIGRSGGLITYETSLLIGAPASWSWWTGWKDPDSDGDGMPDWWEDANGLNRTNAKDAVAKAANGRLNIENYINSINAGSRQYFLRAPVGLAATADTTTTLKLSWHDYTYGELGFSVEAKLKGEWKEVGRTAANATAYRVTGLAPGTTYELRVRAVGRNNGATAYSGYTTLTMATRESESAEIDIDTYEPDYTLAEGQAYWDGTHGYWVEKTIFRDGGKVRLDTDGAQTVNIQSWVRPHSVVVNGTGDLTLRKTGYLAEYEGEGDEGKTSINKGNSGTLTLLGASGFTGKIVNHEGTIYFDTIADGGSASSLGASSADPVNWVFDGGGYVYTGGSASSNRGMLFRRASSFGVSGSSLTLTGAIDGPGDFILDGGDGELNIPDANTFFGSKKRGAILRRGTLYLSTAEDGTGSAKNFANGNTVTNIVLAGGHLKFASKNEVYQTYSVPIQVEENTFSYITLATHCYMDSRLTGTGTVQFNIPYVRAFIGKNTKIGNFDGDIIANGTASGAVFLHESYWNCQRTRFRLTGTIGMAADNANSSNYLGGLSGDSGTALRGSDRKNGGAHTHWYIGYANSDEVFAGQINDYAATTTNTGRNNIHKVGTGSWRLTGNSIHTGTTSVEGGTLIVNGSLPAGSAVAVKSGASLKGEGTIYGPLSIENGGTLTPGDETLYGKSLKTNGNVTLYNGCRCVVPLYRASGFNDTPRSNTFKAASGTTWTIQSGTTLELNTGNVAFFRDGNTYQVFDAGSLPTFNGQFTTIDPAVPDKDFTWDLSELYTKGCVKVVANEGYTAPSTSVAARSTINNLSFRDASYILRRAKINGGTPDNWRNLENSEIYYYRSLFCLNMNETDESGVYAITATELTDDAKEAIAESADAVLAEVAGAMSTVAGANGDSWVKVDSAIPGLYYSVESGAEPGQLTEGERVAASSRTKQNHNTTYLRLPRYDGSGFYRIKINLDGN